MRFLKILLFLIPTVSFALNFQGRLFDDFGQFVNAGTVDIKFQIYDPTGTCLLYEESFNAYDMAGTEGYFSILMGKGEQNTATAPQFTIHETLSNNVTLNDENMGCSDPYSPTPTDVRILKTFVNGTELEPNQVIDVQSYAMYANTSNKLDDLTKDDLVQVTGSVNQATVESLAANAPEILSLLAGGSDPALTVGQAAATYVTQADLAANHYTKTEIDTTLSNYVTNADLTANYYDKTQADATFGLIMDLGGQNIPDPTTLGVGESLRWNGTAWEVFLPSSSSSITGVTAGAGLTGGGTTGNVNVDIGQGDGITVNADTIEVNAGAGLIFNAGALEIDSGVGLGQVLNANDVVDCPANQKLQWTSPAGGWSCVTDVDVPMTGTEILTALAGDDGAGSGLDADLLDGNDSAYYLDYPNFTNAPVIYTQTELQTSGSAMVHYDNLTNVPAGLDDGDDDTLAGLSCADGEIAKRVAGAWVCRPDDDTPMTGTEILTALAGDDGAGSGLDADLLDGNDSAYYLDYPNFTNAPVIYTQTELQTSGSASVHFDNLTNVPGGLADGDDDTLNDLGCANGEIAKLVAGTWQCSPVVNWTTLGSIPAILADDAIDWAEVINKPVGVDDQALATAVTIDAAGNVGIGVVPSAKLDVGGTVRATELCDETGANCFDISSSWTYGTVTSITAGNGLTGGTITTSGTIAVDSGVTAGKIIQLDGSARIPAVDGSLLTNLDVGEISSGASKYFGYRPNDVACGDGDILTWDDTNSRWSCDTDTDTVDLPAAPGNAAAPAYAFTTDTTSGMFSPGVNQLGLSTGGTERVRVDASGNVGIGTPSPGEKLEVNGSVLIGANGTALAPSLRINNDDTGFFQPVDNMLAISTAGTERVRIDNTGRIGIGAQTVDTNLQIGDASAAQSMLIFGDDANANSSKIYFSGSSGGTAPDYDGMSVGYDNVAHDLKITDESGSNVRFLIERDTGRVGLGVAAPLSQLHVSGGIQIGSDGAACDGTKAGTLRYNAGSVEYCNGTAWDAFQVSGDSIVNLNGSTQTSQSFANGFTGLTPNWVTNAGAGTHTLHIPMANTASVTSGLISKAEYDTFDAKLDPTLTDGMIFVGNGSNVATGVTPSGDVSMTNAGAVTVEKIQGSDVHTVAPSVDGQILRWDNTNTRWEASTSGSALTNLNATQLTSGTVPDARMPAFSGDATSSAGATALTLSNSGVTAGTYTSVTVDAKGRVTAATNPTTLAGYGITDAVNKGGDTMTGALNLPTNGLAVGTDQLIVSGGNVGVGVLAPQTDLQIGDASAAQSMLLFGDDANVNSSKIYFSGSSGGTAPDYDGMSVGYDNVAHDLKITDESGSNVRFLIERDTGRVGLGVAAPLSQLHVSGGIQIGSDGAACDGTKAGTLRYNAGSVEYCNGTAWDAFQVSGDSIVNLNGSTETSQSFANGFTGLTPNWVTNAGAGTHTLHIPMANTASVTSGLISKAEYDTFDAKLDPTLTDGMIFVGNGSNVATGVTPSGDVSMTNAGAVTVEKIQGSDVHTVAPSVDGQILRWDNTNTRWEASTSGSALTNLNATQLTSGTVPDARMPAFSGDATSSAGATALTLANSGVTAGTYTSVTVDAKGRVTAATNPTTLAGYGITDAVNKGGDTMTGALNLPTNGLAVGTDQLIVSGGNVGVGVLAPQTDLQIGDASAAQTMLLRGPDANANSSKLYFGGGAGVAPAYDGMSVGYDSTSEYLKITDEAGTNIRMIVDRDSGEVGVGTASPTSLLHVAGGVQIGTDAATCDGTKAGTLRYNGGLVEYCNGTAWDAFQVNGDAIINLNGSTETSQTFANGSTGLAPNWVTNAGAGSHTLHIPMANTASVTSGLISKAEYDTFDAKLDPTLTDGMIFVGNGSNVATGVTPSGDVSMTNAGAVTVEKIQGSDVHTVAPSVDGQILRWDNTNTRWEASTSGSALTNLNATQLTSGTVPDARMPAFSGDATSSAGATALTLANSGVTAGTYTSVTVDAKGRVTAATNPTTLAGYGITDAVNKGGDTMTGALNLPTNGLAVGTDQLIVSGGNVGVGVLAPQTDLQIGDASAAQSMLLFGDDANANSSKIYFSGSSGGTAPDYDGMSVGYDNVAHDLKITDESGSNVRFLIERDTGRVGLGVAAPLSQLHVSGGIQIGSDGAACDGTKAGTLRYNAGSIEYCNGTAWDAFQVNGDAIINLNGSTETSQTFANGSTGLAPNWVTNAGAGSHTLHIPMANTASVTSGLISKAEYDTFDAKLDPTLTDGMIFVGNGSNVATGVTPSGDVSMTNAGAVTVEKIQGSDVHTVAPSVDGQILRWDNTNTRWEASTSGSALTNLNATQLTSGTVPDARMPAFSGDATSSAGATALTLSNSGVTAGTYTSVTVDAKGRVTAATNPTTLAGYGITDAVNKGGDTMTGALNLPTNGLAVGTDQLIVSGGNVGVGVLAPQTDLQIGDASAAQTMLLRGPDANANSSKLYFGGGAGVAPAYDGMSVGYDSTSEYLKITDEAGTNIRMIVDRDSGEVGVGTASPTSLLHVAGGVQIGTDAATCDGTKAGTLRYNGGLVEYCNGTAWDAFQVNGDAIINLNGSTETSQTFANGSTGLAPNWVTNAGAGSHTLHIPMANTASVTSGLISKAEYDTFDAKLDPTLTDGMIFVGNGSNVATGVTPSGDVSMTNAGAVTVEKIQGSDVHTVAPSVDGQILRWDNTNTRWEASTSGSALTNLNATQLTSGTVPDARMPAFSGDATSSAGATALTLANSGVTAGTYTSVTVDAKGRVTAATNPTTLAGYGITDAVNKGGDTMTGALNLPTNGLAVGTDQLIVSGGNVGVGVLAPQTDLQIGDASAAQTMLLRGPDANANSSKLYFGGGAGVAPAYDGMSVGYDSTSEYLKITDEAGTNIRMIVDRDSGEVGVGTASPTSLLHVAGGVQIGTDAATCDGTKAGTLRYNGGLVEYCNGTAWDAFQVNGDAIINLNGSTETSQTFANGSTGLAPNWVTNAGAGSHTLHIPMANTASVTSGLISKAEYDTFDAKLDPTLTDGMIFVGNGSNVATGVTPSGDVSMTNAGAVTVEKIQGSDVHTVAPSVDGQILRWDNTNTRWEASTSGSALTNLNATQLTSGTVPDARMPAFSGDATSSAGATALTLANSGVTAGTYTSVTVDAKGRVTAATNPTTLAGYGITDAVNKGGDTMTGALNLPTNGLAVGTDQLIVSGGNVGVGVLAPQTDLQIGDASAAQTMLLRGPDANANSSKLYFGGGAGVAPAYDGMSVGYDSTSEYLKITDEAGTNIRMIVDRDSGEVGVGTASPTSLLHVAGGVQIGTDAATCDGTKAGTLRYNGGLVEYCNGTAWDAFQVNGDAIINLNGSTETSQTFANGSTGLAPNWVTNAGAGSHTLHIPMAGTASVTAGLISKTEYDYFDAKLDPTLTDGMIFVGNGSNVATGVTPSGDVSMTNAGAVTVEKIQGSDVHTVAPSAEGQMLRWNNTNTRWEASTSGADLTALNATQLTSGTVPDARMPAFSGDATSSAGATALTLANSGVTAGTYTSVTVDAKGRVTAATNPTTLAGYGITDAVNKGGDTMTGTLNLPSNGLTVGTNQLIVSGGNVGVGVTSPVVDLQVGDASAAQEMLLRGPDANANSSKIYFGGGTGVAPGYDGMSVGYDSSSDYLKVTDESGSNIRLVVERDSGEVGIGTASPTSLLHVAGGVQIGTDAGACNGARAGTIRYNSGSVEYCNGTIWDPLQVIGDSIINLNGSVEVNQTFASGTSGTAPNWSTNVGAGSHTLNIPDASVASVTAGTISKTKYDEFDNKLDSVLNDGQIFVGNGSNVATGVTPSSDISMTNTGVVTVEKIQGSDIHTVAPSVEGQFLRWNNTNSRWEASTSGSGLTNLNADQLTSGTVPEARMPAFSGDATSSAGSTALTLANSGVTAGTYTSVTVDAKGRVTAATNPTTLAGYGITDAVNLGGDTMTGTLNLPSNGLTVGTSQLVVSGGNIGVGTASPTHDLGLGGNAARSIGMERRTVGTTGLDLTLQAGGSSSGSSNQDGGDLVLSSGIATGSGSSDINFQTATAGGAGSTDRNPTTKMVILGSGNVGIGVTAPTSALQVSGGVQIADDTDTCDGTKVGTMRYNSGKIEYCNGSSWRFFNIDGATVVSLNGSGEINQTLAVGTSGTSPNWSTNVGAGSHTLNIPDASAASVTAGTISKTEYDDFDNKLDPTLADGSIFVGNGSNLATAVTPSGDLSMTNTGVVTVTHVQGREFSSAAPGGEGYMLRWNGTTSEWESSTDASSLLNINASGLSFGTVPAGRMPAFSGDVTSSSGSTVLSLADSGVTAGTYRSVTVDAKGRVTAATNPTTLAGYGITDAVNKGGDTMTGTLNLPANGLVVGTTQLVASGGDIGIGTASPTSQLHVNGGVQVGMDSATCDSTKAGTMRFNSGNMEYCNGASWAVVGATGAGITTFNGSTNSTQSFATPGTTGTAPNWSTVGATGVHTLHIPMASTASVTAGLISNTDYDYFQAKVSNVSGVPSLEAGTDAGKPSAGTTGKLYFTTDALHRRIYRDNGSSWDMVGTNYYNELKNIFLGSPWPGTSCAAGQFLDWYAVVDGFVCQSMASGDITTALGYTPVDVSGDTMTGTLNLPSNGLVVGTNELVVSSSSVGIGTASPGYALEVVGDAAKSTGTSWINTSDARLKDIRGSYEYGLDEILKLNPVRYNYIEDNPIGLPSDKEIIGFIAQDVQKVIPEAVSMRDDGYLQLDVDPIHWASVNAVKELYYKCDDSDKELEELTEISNDIQSENAKLMSENDLLVEAVCEIAPDSEVCQ